MSTDNKALAAVSSAVVPPPTTRELLQAAAQAISEDNKAKNDKRWAAREKAQEAFRKAARKAARKNMHKFLDTASVEVEWRNPGVWLVKLNVKVELDDNLKALRKAVEEADAVPRLATCPEEILKQLKTRAAGHTQENIRVSTILSIPALRKAAKEFGEKLLSSPTQADKANAVDVGGGK